MPYLKPCPFCACEQIVIRYGKSGWRSNIYYPKEAGYVECVRCKIRTKKYNYVKRAVDDWNRRWYDAF